MKEIFSYKSNHYKQYPVYGIKRHRILSDVLKHTKFYFFSEYSEKIVRHNNPSQSCWKKQQIITPIHIVGMHVKIWEITYYTQAIDNNY